MAERVLPYPYKQAGLLLPSHAEAHVQSEIFQGYDILPSLLIANLIDLSESLAERKHEYSWVNLAEVPMAIHEASQFFADVFQMQSDTAVLKRYDASDPYKSGAYIRHGDPAKYRKHRVALNSLSGDVITTVWDRYDREHPFRSRPNSTLIFPGSFEHQVTPPLNTNGIRHFLFLGKTSR